MDHSVTENGKLNETNSDQDRGLPIESSVDESKNGNDVELIGDDITAQIVAGEYSSDDELSGKIVGPVIQEPYTVNMDMSGLSNEDLSHKLKSLGVDLGPIVGSTRRLYEKKLASLLSAGRPDGPAAPVLDEFSDGDELRADEPAAGGSAVRRRLGGGAVGEFSCESGLSGAAGGCDLACLDPDSPALRPVFLRDETDQPSPRRAVSDLRDVGSRVRDVSSGRRRSQHVAYGADYEEELRPWVRHFVKLCIILAFAGVGYYLYHSGGDWPAVRSLQEAVARAAPAPRAQVPPVRPPVAPPAAAANN